MKIFLKLLFAVALGWLAYFLIAKSDAYAAKVTGRVYVVTKGQDVIKMANVSVLALNQDALLEAMRNCSEQFQSEYNDYRSRFDRAAGNQKLNVSDGWSKRRAEIVISAIARAKSLDDARNYMGKAEEKLFQLTRTDSDGNYFFKLPKAGRYLIIGVGDRLIFDNTENYFWLRRGDFQNFKTYTADLSNESDIARPELSQDEDTLLVLTMIRHAGLRAFDLPDGYKLTDRALFIP